MMVDSATTGLEFTATKIASHQIMESQMILLLYIFFSQRVVTSNSMKYSLLSKRHNALVHQQIREKISSKILGNYCIHGRISSVEIVSKLWG
jgi:hypothetical protein